MSTQIRRLDGCSDAEIAAFCCLVRQAGEVEPGGLEGRVRQAKALAFLYVEGTLVGVAALKQPRSKYRSDVFKKAGVPHEAASFDLELGWVHILPEYRGKHYSGVLSAAAKSQSDGAPIFATTRSENIKMQKTLEHLRFKKIGNPFASGRGEYMLLLYVASASGPVRSSLAEVPTETGPRQMLARAKKPR